MKVAGVGVRPDPPGIEVLHDVVEAVEDGAMCLIEDDEIDGAAFASVGTLIEFVEAKLA